MLNCSCIQQYLAALRGRCRSLAIAIEGLVESAVHAGLPVPSEIQNASAQRNKASNRCAGWLLGLAIGSGKLLSSSSIFQKKELQILVWLHFGQAEASSRTMTGATGKQKDGWIHMEGNKSTLLAGINLIRVVLQRSKKINLALTVSLCEFRFQAKNISFSTFKINLEAILYFAGYSAEASNHNLPHVETQVSAVDLFILVKKTVHHQNESPCHTSRLTKETRCVGGACRVSK